MSNVCCKELQGWCKSFTKTEIILCVFQAVLLVVFFASLTFLVLHLVVCSRNKLDYDRLQARRNRSSDQIVDPSNKGFENSTVSSRDVFTQSVSIDDHREPADINRSHSKVHTTLHRGIKCTWIPSFRTKAETRYYDNSYLLTTQFDKTMIENQNKTDVERTMHWLQIDNKDDSELEDNKLLEDLPDGNEIYDSRKDFLLALVKIRPPQHITFGCTLTIVNEHWTVTAASCIEAIEEVDSLDSFVMMQGFKEQDRNIHPVADVMIHPQYQGVNATFDLAALKSEGRLVDKGTAVVTLPTLVDFFLITIGEALTILGFGRFRNIDADPLTRSVRAVWAHSVPPAQCPGPAAWAPRHLGGGAARAHGACGAAPVCAGVLRARAAPCNYCAGSPLLARRVLLGVMGAGGQCGLACEPALFVNLARVRDWLDSVLAD